VDFPAPYGNSPSFCNNSHPIPPPPPEVEDHGNQFYWLYQACLNPHTLGCARTTDTRIIISRLAATCRNEFSTARGPKNFQKRFLQARQSPGSQQETVTGWMASAAAFSRVGVPLDIEIAREAGQDNDRIGLIRIPGEECVCPLRNIPPRTIPFRGQALMTERAISPRFTMRIFLITLCHHHQGYLRSSTISPSFARFPGLLPDDIARIPSIFIASIIAS